MIKFFKKVVIVVPILVFISSCTLDDDPLPEEATIKYVNTDIDTITYWTKSVIYVINKADFRVNDTLIIQGGTIVKFNPDNGRTMTITDSGYISAQGSTDKQITFTSLNDNVHGAIDGKSNNAAIGDWDNIQLFSKKNCSFNLCNFYFGGGGETKSTLIINKGASVIIKGCTFANNDGGDLTNGNGVLNAQEANNEVIIRNNTFYNNNLPYCINTSVNVDSTNIFHNHGDLLETNKYNAIKVATKSKLKDTIAWMEDEVAFVISGPKFELLPNASLLLGNDITLKFCKDTYMVLLGPNSTLRNHEGPGVVFTSVYDDSRKGDSNGDSNTTQPSEGDWSLKVNNPELFEWGNIFYVTKITR